MTTKSIIDPKYRGKYRADKDWLAVTIDNHVQVKQTKERQTKNEDGSPGPTEVVTLKQTRIDMDRLFALADVNGIDARAKYGDQVERKNAPGRLRMTIGNMLRAVAKRRHGLFVPDTESESGKTWVDADELFINGGEKTENPDGSKIAKTKAELAAAGDEAPKADEEAGDEAPTEEETAA